MEAICSYLGSPIAQPAGKDILLREAKEILMFEPPSEDTAFAILFVSQCDELVEFMCSHWKGHAFEELDPWGQNTRNAWSSANLTQRSLLLAFKAIEAAHHDGFTEDLIDTLKYAIDTRSPAILAHVSETYPLSSADIADVLCGAIKMSWIRPDSVNEFVHLIGRCKDSPLWNTYFKMRLNRGDVMPIAIALGAGVDISPYAIDLKQHTKPCFHPMLDKASSNHGRLEIIAKLKDPTEMIKISPDDITEILIRLGEDEREIL